MRRSIAIALLSSVTAFAWGPEGHSLIARIAEGQLTPAARSRVTAILAAGQTMASIASWADDVRRSRPESAGWHFVDIPIEKPHLDMERDCPKGNCIVAKIADLKKTLLDAETPPEQRREALMYLVHFMGDMHQPLHCSDHNDRGGNSVRVVFYERQTNLHSLWDSGMLGRLAPADQLFPVLAREAARRRKKWSRGTVPEWAEDSHRAAQKMVYARLPKVAPGTPESLGTVYEKKADPLIEEQLEKGGVRLAAVLNELFR